MTVTDTRHGIDKLGENNEKKNKRYCSHAVDVNIFTNCFFLWLIQNCVLFNYINYSGFFPVVKVVLSPYDAKRKRKVYK